ncbi:MAG: hypothetical protein BWY11_01197 [Firmicutes bacterium ADurb.Bin182]|nr:MAG: hypothetical protein BWY11_01197 [Firmicutes bacterium ADurb.Bin182]
MLILFFRSVILYTMVFAILRLTGKRQISDLQPFDLVMTLLLAELASHPASDIATPLLYGAVPILTLFLVQQLLAYLSLKSHKIRSFVCGRPLIVIANGIIQESVLKAARYTMNDLLEQLRIKDIFEIDKVAYAILETNGSLSVLPKGIHQQPSFGDFKLKPPEEQPPHILVLDGTVFREELQRAGKSEEWLKLQLQRMGVKHVKDVFFASLSANGLLHVQDKERAGGKDRRIQTTVTDHG